MLSGFNLKEAQQRLFQVDPRFWQPKEEVDPCLSRGEGLKKRSGWLAISTFRSDRASFGLGRNLERFAPITCLGEGCHRHVAGIT
jgi:hypothetical protein